MNTCYPSTTDWGCLSEADLAIINDPQNAEQVERALALGWSTLASLTGWRLQTCPTTVRPCSAGCAGFGGGSYNAFPINGSPGDWMRPGINAQGLWVNYCGCRTECNCGPLLSRIFLPGTVGGIDSVWVNGIERSKATYRVDNGNELVSLTDPWPSCQDMNGGRDDDDTFFVSYYNGFAPDLLTNYVAGVLSWEFYLACTGGKGCKLPAGVTTITRQGVSMEIQTGLWTNGKTGLQVVDDVIAQINPYGLRQAPQIHSPETLGSGFRRTSWEG